MFFKNYRFSKKNERLFFLIEKFIIPIIFLREYNIIVSEGRFKYVKQNEVGYRCL